MSGGGNPEATPPTGGPGPRTSPPLVSPPDAIGHAKARQVGYTYDGLHRVTQAGYTAPSTSPTVFGYDLLGNDQTEPVTVAEYRYDAVGRRIEYKRYSETGTLLETIRYYHDGQNVIGEYTYTEPGGVPTETLARTYVNGTQYIDERVVVRDYQTGPEPRDHYYLHEELYSEAGLVGANGALEEAYVYDTYGEARIYDFSIGDLNHDGTVGGPDHDFIVANMTADGVPTSYPFADLDQDGDVDDADRIALEALGGQPIAELAFSSVRNPYLFTGRTTDTWHATSLLVSEDGNFRRMQDNRNRVYDPRHGRFLQRDRLGTVVTFVGGVDPLKQMMDGSSLYQYAKSRSTTLVDPRGLLTSEEFQWSKAHPLCAIRVSHLEGESQSDLKRKFGASQDHTVANAIHHCQTMCKIAASCLCGPDLALELGALHEANSPPNQRRMDMHNNDEGISCYTEDKADTWGACFKCCLKKAMAKQLYWYHAVVYQKDRYEWNLLWFTIFDGLPAQNPDFGWTEEGL